MKATQSRLFSAGRREPGPLSVLSLGAGQESTALALLLLKDPEFREKWSPGRYLCVMSDTGDEHPETYENVERLRDLYERHGEEFHFLEAGSRWHSDSWPDLLTFYRRGDRIGSKSFPKSCSQQLKIAVIYRFLEEMLANDYGVSLGNKRGFREFMALVGEKITVMIGLSAEEAERRLAKDDKAPKWMKETVNRVYPLIEMGWTRGDCQDYIRARGFPLPYPSLCRHCPYKTELDILRMSRDDPEGFTEWVDLERNKLDAHSRRFPDLPEEKNHGVFGANATLPEVLERAKEKYAHLTDAQLSEARMAGHGVASRY